MENGKSQPPVRVNGLRKSFGEQKVLNGVDLQVNPGETLAVLGRSGTGKSVLLKLIVGLQHPDSGSICVHGQDVAGLDLDRLNQIRKKIGFLFQQAALYDSMTVEENVAFPLKRHTEASQQDTAQHARQLLAQVGMERDLKKMPSELSGGMQKRVGLARALALEPDILLLDEPTAGLDPITASEIGELILRLRRERHMASIVVTHDVRRARMFADRVLLLNEGNVVVEGTFEDLENSREEFVTRFLQANE
jgi:phospholipid/cholesterol/gamma-HCH transport system ATP-binding protein